jgi:hypothetical protein
MKKELLVPKVENVAIALTQNTLADGEKEYSIYRFAATRRAGDSPQMLIKSTKVPVTTNLFLEHKTPPFG